MPVEEPAVKFAGSHRKVGAMREPLAGVLLQRDAGSPRVHHDTAQFVCLGRIRVDVGILAALECSGDHPAGDAGPHVVTVLTGCGSALDELGHFPPLQSNRAGGVLTEE